MKIQHLDAEYAGKQDNYKTHALKPKKDTWRKKKIGKPSKGCQFLLEVSDEDEGADVEQPIPNEKNQMNKELEAQELNPQDMMNSQLTKILETIGYQWIQMTTCIR